MSANHSQTRHTRQNLTWRERALVMRASIMLPMVEMWMRRNGFRKCQRGLKSLVHIGKLAPPLKADSLTQAQRTAELVGYSNKRYSLYVADCLTRSLVTQYFLMRMGIPAELKLGARTITGQFEAHAWVEYDGHALNETEDVQTIYTAFDWHDPDNYNFKT